MAGKKSNVWLRAVRGDNLGTFSDPELEIVLHKAEDNLFMVRSDPKEKEVSIDAVKRELERRELERRDAKNATKRLRAKGSSYKIAQSDLNDMKIVYDEGERTRKKYLTRDELKEYNESSEEIMGAMHDLAEDRKREAEKERTDSVVIKVLGKNEFEIVAEDGKGDGREYYIGKEGNQWTVDIFDSAIEDKNDAYIESNLYNSQSDAWDAMQDDLFDYSNGEMIITDDEIRKALEENNRKYQKKKSTKKGGGKRSKARSKTSGWSKLKEELPTSAAVRARLKEGDHTEGYIKVLKSLQRYWEKRSR